MFDFRIDESENCTAKRAVNPTIHILVQTYFRTSTILAILNIFANLFSFHIFKQGAWNSSKFSVLLKHLSLCEILFNANVLLDSLIILLNKEIIDVPNFEVAVAMFILKKIANLLMLTFQILTKENKTNKMIHPDQ